jgi:hypothetical protein
MKRTTTIEIVSFLLILLFIYTATSKLFDYNKFNFQMHFYPWIKRFGGFISWALPTLELTIAILILIPKTKLIGFYASIILLATFTIYLILMLLFNYNLPCSCGGVISKMTWKQHVIFNIVFIVINWVGIYKYPQKYETSLSKQIKIA